eukprot:1180470-Prorocentrum_minimum.AAC.1
MVSHQQMIEQGEEEGSEEDGSSSDDDDDDDEDDDDEEEVEEDGSSSDVIAYPSKTPCTQNASCSSFVTFSGLRNRSGEEEEEEAEEGGTRGAGRGGDEGQSSSKGSSPIGELLALLARASSECAVDFEGSGVYLSVAWANHSCRPNASAEFPHGDWRCALTTAEEVPPGAEVRAIRTSARSCSVCVGLLRTSRRHICPSVSVRNRARCGTFMDYL